MPAIPVKQAKSAKTYKPDASAYGGVLLKTRHGRSRPRPLTAKHTMHLVLRSSKAKGAWSLSRPHNEKKVRAILDRFAFKHHITILKIAVVGNHLHLQIRLIGRAAYMAFIRSTTSAIAMAVTGVSRWNKKTSGPFWDYRPFTRIVLGLRQFINLQNYIQINQLEGLGYSRLEAKIILWETTKRPPP